MPLYSIPRRTFTPQPATEPTPVNWRRGLFRVWVLISAAWMMSWVIYLILDMLRSGFRAVDLLVVPVLLFGPPVALLIFALAAGWAFRGFKVADPAAAE
jgi:hypothetical protein